MRLFNPGGSPYQAALAMVGARAGDAVLVLGADDPDFCAEIARVTGLNGRTAVADTAPDVARLEAAGGRAGGLIEPLTAPLDRLPLDADVFDIVVVQGPLETRSASVRSGAVNEARRVLRKGGRIVLVEGSRRPGFLGLWRSAPPVLTEAAVRTLLGTAGFGAIRALAHTEGITYWEARK